MEGSLARALYTFQATQPDELSVQEGDIIRVTQYINNHWLEAEHQGQTGLFPVSYAKRLESETHEEHEFPRNLAEQWLYDNSDISSHSSVKQCMNTSGEGTFVEAAFGFDARNNSELTFPAGAVIALERDVDDHWLEGSFNGKTGLFPKSYIKMSSERPCARAVYPFVGESTGELTFREGERIYLRKRLNSQWMEGEVNGTVGLFPSSFVAVEVDLPPDNSVDLLNGEYAASASTHELSNRSNKATKKFQWKEGMRGKALFHFTALYSGDLELNEGDIVTVICIDDDNWIEGRLENGTSGSCPAAYLEPIIDDVGTASKARQPSSKLETQTFSNFVKSVWAFDSDTHYVNLRAQDDREGNDVVDAYDHKSLLDSSFSEDFTPVLMPHNTNSLGNSYLTPRKPTAKPKPAVKPKPAGKYSVTYLGSENKSSQYMARESTTMPHPAVSMPSILVDFSSNTASDSNSFLESRTRLVDSSQHSEYGVRCDESSLPSSTGYDTGGTWPRKKPVIHRNSNITVIERKEATHMSEFDGSDLLSGSCELLPSPLIPLPHGERDGRQSDSSEGSPITPRRPAPPPPRKNGAGSNHIRSRTLPASHSKTLVEHKGISQTQQEGKYSKPDIEMQHTRPNLTSPTYTTRGPSPSPRGSPKGRVGITIKPKTLPRSTLVNLRKEGVDSGQSENKGHQDLKRSSSLEQLSATKLCSEPQTDKSAVFSHEDTDTYHSLEFDNVPGLAKLEERIAETQLNLQKEMKVHSGMKTISQLIMTDPVKQREMEAKLSRSQQKIVEWQEELKHMKDEQAFLVESHRKKVLKVKIADLESDLEKQVRSQKSLETLLGVVEDTRKKEVMENLGTCAQLIEKIQMKLKELEASLHSLTEKPAASSQKHMAEQRQKVVTEMVNTERDYCNDLELCVKYFLFELKQLQLRELDCESLFGNIENVLGTSRKLLKSLENAAQDDEGNSKDQELGKCFMDIADEMKEVYCVYCRNHDDAIALMEKYEEVPEIQDVFTKCLDKIREHTRCWDLSSFLIKPVQRVLKYPLLLNELLKYTPEIHRDKYNLLQATSMMTDVANAINEFKRRKDLVVKYKRVEDTGLTNMIQKLSWHSVGKKASRFNQRLTQLTGLVPQTVDEKFIEEEKKFRGMEKTVKALWKNITAFLEEFQESALYQQLSGEYISEYYHEAATCSEVTIYQKVQNVVRETILNRFMDCVQRQVLSPLTSLLNLFQGPQRVIQKRHDKCLDYDHWSNKIDKIKDRDKLKAAKDELELAKKNYEALNTQLLEEIPGFTKKCMALMVDCLKNFAVAQRRLYHEIQQEYEQLLELPVVQNREGDIVEHHAKRSVQAVEQFSDLSFIPCSFVAKDSSRKKRKSQRFPALPSVDPNAVVTDDTPNPKGDEPVERTKISPAPLPRLQRASSDDPPRPRPVPRKQSSTPKQDPQDADYLQRVEVTPGEGKMHIVEFTFESQNVGELSVSKGSQVAVLRHCDTSGNPEWWLVNWNGSTGYVPQTFLSPLDPANKEITTVEDPEDGEISREDTAGSSDEKPTENVYYYAEFVFEANSAAEVSLDESQVVVVLQKHDLLGNDEWWLVDADGEKGYVPACYLTPVEE